MWVIALSCFLSQQEKPGWHQVPIYHPWRAGFLNHVAGPGRGFPVSFNLVCTKIMHRIMKSVGWLEYEDHVAAWAKDRAHLVKRLPRCERPSTTLKQVWAHTSVISALSRSKVQDHLWQHSKFRATWDPASQNKTKTQKISYYFQNRAVEERGSGRVNDLPGGLDGDFYILAGIVMTEVRVYWVMIMCQS